MNASVLKMLGFFFLLQIEDEITRHKARVASTLDRLAHQVARGKKERADKCRAFKVRLLVTPSGAQTVFFLAWPLKNCKKERGTVKVINSKLFGTCVLWKCSEKKGGNMLFLCWDPVFEMQEGEETRTILRPNVHKAVAGPFMHDVNTTFQWQNSKQIGTSLTIWQHWSIALKHEDKLLSW